MIPSAGLAGQAFQIKEQPTKTYRMDRENHLVRGYTDGLEAMRQAIYKAILTERYQYSMYSWNYGIELLDLFGEPVSYVCPELERRIAEALLWDKRINGVDSFAFDFPEKGVVSVSFTVHTVFGDVRAERKVNF